MSAGLPRLSRSQLLLYRLVVLGLFLILLVYAWYPSTTVIHTKITVSVQTPEGVKSGSNVREIAYTPPFYQNEHGDGGLLFSATIKRTGEATILDLGQGRYLFVLLDVANTPWDLFFQSGLPDAEMLVRLDMMIGQSRLYQRDEYFPLLATFGDPSDPASVRKVDPDHLDATFGPGYSLLSLTMTITDEPVTKGEVEKLLGWLGPYPEPRLIPATGQTRDVPFARTLSHGDFIRR